jgi:hypothetical protein
VSAVVLRSSLLGAWLLACGGCGPKSAGASPCAELSPEASAFEARFADDPRLNARAAVFVQAAKDLGWASAALEQEVAGACQRVGRDVGLTPAELAPQDGPGGVALGACDPVNARVEAILRAGVRPWLTVTPPECAANAGAAARCAARCDVRVDPYCAASCKAHGGAHASCTEARVGVRLLRGEDQVAAFVATLEANLPSLVEARFRLEQLIAPDTTMLLQAAARLRADFAGESHAEACAGASTDLLIAATKRNRLVLRTSGDILARIAGE